MKAVRCRQPSAFKPFGEQPHPLGVVSALAPEHEQVHASVSPDQHGQANNLPALRNGPLPLCLRNSGKGLLSALLDLGTP